MSFQERSYEPRSSYGGSQGFAHWSAVKTLIVLNVLIFLLQVFMPGVLERHFSLSPDLFLNGQIWRVTTYDFLHSTAGNLPWHLLFNMLLLWFTGQRVEAKLGKKEFLWFYLIAGIVSGLFFVVWSKAFGQTAPAVGASGAAVAVLIVYAVNWPREVFLIWGILPMPIYILAIITALFDIIPMLRELSGGPVQSNIAHAAHFGGMLFGLLYAQQNWTLSQFGRGLNVKSVKRAFRKRPKLEIVRPDNDPSPRPSSKNFDASRLDSILEKISNSGEASLTDEERSFLIEASRRMRDSK